MIESTADLANSLPRSFIAFEDTNTGLIAPISANTGIGIFRSAPNLTSRRPTLPEPVNPIAEIFGC